MSQIASAPRAPYSLEPIAFPFPALAGMAGNAPLGGPREIALACFLVARLAGDVANGAPLTAEQWRARAQGAKHWLGTAAVPPAIRAALLRLAEATGTGDPRAVEGALDSVMTITANQLDPGPRLEFARLAQAVAK